jgi:hypothetical protein
VTSAERERVNIQYQSSQRFLRQTIVDKTPLPTGEGNGVRGRQIALKSKEPNILSTTMR